MAKTQQRLPCADAPVLPVELIMEILSWVPIKSLMLFRCVSKTWNSLMFDPTLVKLHHQRSSKNIHLLVRSTGTEDHEEWLTTCTIRGLFENPSSTIDDYCDQIDHNDFFVGSSNGLVCLIAQDFKGEELWVRFWNPATRIMSEGSPHFSTLHSFNLRPNNWDQQFVKYGFGYDEWSDSYKVVIFLLDAKSENWVVKVHCLGDTCWRYILTCPAFPMLGERDGQFACGSLNWLVIQKSGYDYQWKTVTVKQLAILSFDLNKETYKYFLMPDDLSEVPVNEPNLGVLKGCLCLSHDHRRTHFVVWLMREYGVEKSWTQLLNVTYELHQYFFSLQMFKPVCVSENDDVLLLAVSFDDKFMLCNLRDNRIERAEDFKDQALLSSHDYVPRQGVICCKDLLSNTEGKFQFLV